MVKKHGYSPDLQKSDDKDDAVAGTIALRPVGGVASVSFPYTSEQIREIVKATKKLRRPELLPAGGPIPFAAYEGTGRRLMLDVDLADQPAIVQLGFHVRAPIFDNPETYEAALLLAHQRVRGIGWDPTGKRRLYGKQIVPKGWHQNVIDLNLPQNHPDFNRHLSLDAFEPTDLADFFIKAAALWHIDLPLEKGLFQ